MNRPAREDRHKTETKAVEGADNNSDLIDSGDGSGALEGGEVLKEEGDTYSGSGDGVGEGGDVDAFENDHAFGLGEFEDRAA